MKIHEYQAKTLFARFGIPVPEGAVAGTPDEARDIAAKLSQNRYVVKAQIHAGGRGKGGGVKLVESPEEVYEAARNLLGQNLVTPQTGPEGRLVRQVLVEAAHGYRQEFYVGLTLDRNLAQPVIMVSSAGGMDIEEVAEKTPELIFREALNPRWGFLAFQGGNLAQRLKWEGSLFRTGAALFANLYRLFSSLDASLAEINPLVVTDDGRLLALDAKINIDDNALFRHPEMEELVDPNEMDPLELEASRYKLNYIRLDGNIGAMVNGAGLAMATMDLIKQAGAEPANFLDVGGGADAVVTAQGFRIILSDERVKAILINIFGGILRCDVLAQGVVEAAKAVQIKVPIIVRLEGTNKEEGQRLLNDSGIDFAVAYDLRDAAEKVANLVR
ncbi:MAG: ADP-forming succinate--CoA ligase subunit beta [Deltaproteobacteria bacterium]|nr:ADP-forming succinate--CoA ligase subunit beta [Deltaproteobacteria bacterium]MBW2140558.1 ADP-forming succinate--CoA ligase subunit beta [Deltaproteobacteria bacterium]